MQIKRDESNLKVVEGYELTTGAADALTDDSRAALRVLRRKGFACYEPSDDPTEQETMQQLRNLSNDYGYFEYVLSAGGIVLFEPKRGKVK